MRPLTPVPITLPKSAPSSRANLRTDGLACAFENACSSTAAGSWRGASGGLGAAGAAERGTAAGGAAAGRAAGVEPGAALAGGAFSDGAAAVGDAVLLPFGAEAGAAAGLSAGASAAAAASINKINEPSETLSPVFSLTWAILPATGAGTSMAAFSVS